METANTSEVAVREVKIMEPEVVRDPWELMDGFYSSRLYKDAFNNFFREKQMSPDVTQKEKERVFLESRNAEDALIKYGTDIVDFKYLSSKYPQAFIGNLAEYEKLIKDSQKMDSGPISREELAALDATRFSLHSSAAQVLVRTGIAPSQNIARAIVSLILVDKGLESALDARRTTFEKIQGAYKIQ